MYRLSKNYGWKLVIGQWRKLLKCKILRVFVHPGLHHTISLYFVSFLFFPKRTAYVGILQNIVVPYFLLLNCTYEITSMQNRAHTYVGTIQCGHHRNPIHHGRLLDVGRFASHQLYLEEPISSGYPAQTGLTWRNQFPLVTQPKQD